MKKIFFILISISFISASYFSLSAQNVLQGKMTNMSSGETADIKFARTFTLNDNLYSSDYKLTDKKNELIGALLVVHNKTTKKISVSLRTKKDTTIYEFYYADSLGSLFGLHGTFKKEPVNKYELSLAFLTLNKTYLKVNQVMDKNPAQRTHYLLERILGDDLTLNYSFLKKLSSQPEGNGNIPQTVSAIKTPLVSAPTPVGSTPSTQTAPAPAINNPIQLPPPVQVQPAPPVTTPVKSKPIGSNVKAWMSDSLHIILKPIPNKIISVRFYLRGGTSNYTVAKEGIEAMALQWATSGGTKSFKAEELQNKLQQLGTSISYRCDFDFSCINMICTHENFDESWSLFSEIITKPSFSIEEFTTAKEQILNHLKNQYEDPFEKLKRTALDNLFVGKYYDREPYGSEYAVNRMSADEVKKYFTGLICRKKGTLVFTGNLEQDEVNQKMTPLIKLLPAGSFSDVPDSPLEVSAPSIKYQEAESSTNYILGIGNCPSVNNNDKVALQFALFIVNNRLTSELKDKKTLSNDAFIQLADDHQNFSILSLTTHDPDKAIQTIIDEIKKVRKSGFNADEIQKGKDIFLTQYFLSCETNDEIAASLGSSEMNSGWEDAENFYSSVSNLSAGDLNSAVKKYLKGFRFFYYGSKEAANEIIFTQKIE